MKTRHRKYAQSSSFQMALLFTILCGAVALTLGYFINYFATGHFVHSTQSIIESEIRYLDGLDTVPERLDNEGRIYVPLNDSGDLPSDMPIPDTVLAKELLVFDMPDTNRRYAGRAYTMNDGQKILVGVDITDIANDFQFMQWIGGASIAFVMIVVFVSYVISIFVVRGTNNIAGTAYDIMRTGDLSRRVDLTSHWDDLSNMASILNLLFDRIEELMKGIRHVSDNIAHDLRTPLTRMRNHIEGLHKQSENDEYVLLLDEIDNVLNTFNALLRISRIETEQQRSQFQLVQIDTIINDVIDLYNPLAEDKEMTLETCLCPATMMGDRDLLFQAFTNIMDNAIKYTPHGGVIKVYMTAQDQKTKIIIENQTLAPITDDVSNIFTRFYRLDSSRNTPGTGLGLSLVSAIVELHGGTVIAQKVNNGLQIITHL